MSLALRTPARRSWRGCAQGARIVGGAVFRRGEKYTMDKPNPDIDPFVAEAYASARSAVERGSSVTLLLLDRGEVSLVSGSGDALDSVAVLDIAPDKIANDFLSHDPPIPREMEAAIAAVEDELARARSSVPADSVLVAAGTPIGELLDGMPPLPGSAAPIDIAAVEAWYQRLAAISLGAARSRGEAVPAPAGIATVIVLRECMHHLGFSNVTLLRRPANHGGEAKSRT